MNESIRKQLDGCQAQSIREAALSDRGAQLNDVPSELCEWVSESPENRQIFERLEATDVAIGTALIDVEIPNNLAARLRAAVAEGAVNEKVGAGTTTSFTSLSSAIDNDGRLTPVHREEFAAMIEADEDALRSVRPSKLVPPRRRVLSAFGVVATLAAVILLGMFFSGMFKDSGELISAEQICREAATWDPNTIGSEWNYDLTLAPAAYPASDRMNVSPNQWKEFATDYDSKSIVYDMTPPGDSLIHLFAIRSSDQINVPTTFSSTPIYSVGGFSIGACKRNGVVYVLLVEGDSDRYRKVVKTAGELV